MLKLRLRENLAEHVVGNLSDLAWRSTRRPSGVFQQRFATVGARLSTLMSHSSRAHSDSCTFSSGIIDNQSINEMIDSTDPTA
jgi:hypothetical protein